MVLSTHPTPAPGLTPRQVARHLRIGRDRVRTMIQSGELGAVNHGTAERPRFTVLPQHIDAYVEARAVKPPGPKRRRKAAGPDFYPD
jgi:excisionase family DNA binding protein